MSNGNLTQATMETILGIQKDVREGKRPKDVSAIYDLITHVAGLVIQIQVEGCAMRCKTLFGWPAAVTVITLIIAAVSVLVAK